MSIYIRTARLSDIEGMFDVRTSVIENHLSREEMRQMGITESIVGDMCSSQLKMFTSVLAGNLLKKYDCNIIGTAGLGLLFAGMLLTAALPVVPGNIDIIWRVALCGAGFGLFQSPNNHLIMTSVNDENTSVASGLLGRSRLLGQIVGSALVALFFNINVNDPINCSLITGACFSFFSLAASYWRYISAKAR